VLDLRTISIMAAQDELYEQVLEMRDLLVAACEGVPAGRSEDYRELRADLLASSVAGRVPRFVKRQHTLQEFWPYIKDVDRSWAPRRQHVRDAFQDLLDHLEDSAGSPGDPDTGATFSGTDLAEVRAEWQKAAERRRTDATGAITSARTLLETVCKHILDEREVAYSSGADLPHLYHATPKALMIAPSDHTEQVFKEILGGASAVVNGLGSLRNRLGDSHGVGRAAVRPSSRHAQLAVNLAGAVAVFLVETHLER